MFGPTVGDRVRLADTDLVIEIEKDFTTYGEEVKFGGGKVIRDGMGQSQRTRSEGAVDTVITNAMYTSIGGASISNVGTVIALQRGPGSDLFFLSFDQIGSQTHVHTEPVVPVPPPPANVQRPADIGVKTFAAVNDSMSKITGVSVSDPNIVAAYNQVEQSLPTGAGLAGFLAAHQTAIASLALAYCKQMVDTPALRDSFFGSFNYNSTLASQTDRDQIINAVVDKVVGMNLNSQPDKTAMHVELDALINNTTSGRALGLCQSAACGGARTTAVVTAVCAAGLASGAVEIE